MRGSQGSVSQLQTEVETLANLGINTVMTVPTLGTSPIQSDSEWPGIDIPEVQTVLDNGGLTWRGAAGGSPLDYYFDFYLQYNITQLNSYAIACAKLLTSSYNGSMEKLAVLALIDEPIWYYPNVFGSIPSAPPGQLTVFQQYLSNLPQVVLCLYTYLKSY